MDVNIPYELLFNILLAIKSIKDVLNICASNSIINRICNDDYFWKQRIGLDYPNLSTLIPATDNTYKQLYQRTALIPIVKNITVELPESFDNVCFVNIQPPYVVVDYTYVGLTKSIGEKSYKLGNDAAIIKFGGKWGLAYLPRTADNNARNRVPYKSITWLNNLDEVKNAIDQLLGNNYYIIGRFSISNDEYNKLTDKGFIARINEKTFIQTLTN